MEWSRCPNCDASVPRGALACAECGVMFGRWSREQMDRLDRETDGLAEIVERRTLRRLGVWSMGALTLLTLMFGGSLIAWVRCAGDYLDREIAQQFAHDEVRRTFDRVVRDAATERSQAILETEVRPAVRGLEESIAHEREKLEQSVSAIRVVGQFENPRLE